MSHRFLAFKLISVILLSCATTPSASEDPSKLISRENLNRNITVRGYAVNHKNGAALLVDGVTLWIDKLSSWPDGYYEGGDRGKRLEVRGLLSEAYDLPVFIPKKGEPQKQGIPLPEASDLRKASHRFILKNASWIML